MMLWGGLIFEANNAIVAPEFDSLQGRVKVPTGGSLMYVNALTSPRALL